jgi:acetoin:2,6-dichlorophenolindophenol oxidoreductase subunit alpha
MSHQPTAEQKIWMYRHMLLSRAYENTLQTIYMEGKTPVFNMAHGTIPGEMHLSQGQEPCAVGVCAHLTAADSITATHRPHHIAIAKGVDLKRMTAEIFGKRDGLSGGRGGHMHLFDSKVRFCCSGIIAQGMGPAVGMALARKLSGKPGVAVSFIGEGAANQGAFHEALNLASLWKLPVVFVIEDNAWGISVAKHASTSVSVNIMRAGAYSMPGIEVLDNDPIAIFQEAGEAIARARRGEGPTLIEIETDRLAGHFMGDAEGYRPVGELDRLKARDPIPRMKALLLAERVLDESAASKIEREAQKVVDDAVTFARQSPYPQPLEALEKLYA